VAATRLYADPLGALELPLLDPASALEDFVEEFDLPAPGVTLHLRDRAGGVPVVTRVGVAARALAGEKSRTLRERIVPQQCKRARIGNLPV